MFTAPEARVVVVTDPAARLAVLTVPAGKPPTLNPAIVPLPSILIAIKSSYVTVQVEPGLTVTVTFAPNVTGPGVNYQGNLIIGTVTSNTAGLSTKIVAGGSDEKNIVAQFSNNSISLNRNVNVSGSLTGPTITYLQSEINVVFNQANAAFNKANTGTGGGGGGISDYVSIYKIPVGD